MMSDLASPRPNLTSDRWARSAASAAPHPRPLAALTPLCRPVSDGEVKSRPIISELRRAAPGAHPSQRPRLTHPRAATSEQRVSVPVAVQAAEVAAAATRFAAWINAGAVVIAAVIGAFVVLALAYWPPATMIPSPQVSVQQRWVYSPTMRLQLREHSYAPYQNFIEERAIELVEASRPWDKLRGRRSILGAVDSSAAWPHLERAYETILRQLFDEMVSEVDESGAFGMPGFNWSTTSVEEMRNARLGQETVLARIMPDYEARFERLVAEIQDDILLR